MSDSVLSLTNKKNIQMNLSNGKGGMIRLQPGETQIIHGDFDRYHNMMKSMNGLVVKVVEGSVRLVESKKAVNNVRLMTVTSHRNIPIMLATGVGHKHVKIAPKGTSEPFLGNVSVVKKVHGISVKYVDEPKERPADAAPPETEKVESSETTVAIETTVGEGSLENGATEEAKAIAKQAAEDEAKAKKEAEANDPLAKRRRDLALPATDEEWAIHKEQLTWPDVRGLAKELSIKTGGGATKEQLLEAITQELYPES